MPLHSNTTSVDVLPSDFTITFCSVVDIPNFQSMVLRSGNVVLVVAGLAVVSLAVVMVGFCVVGLAVVGLVMIGLVVVGESVIDLTVVVVDDPDERRV